LKERRINNPFESGLNTFLQISPEPLPVEPAVHEGIAVEETKPRQIQTPAKKVGIIPKRRGVGKARSEGLKEGYVRFSSVAREDTLFKLKALAWWRRMDIYQMVEEALTDYLKKKPNLEDLEKAVETYKG